MNDDDQMSPRTAGWIALGVVVLASLATVLAWQGGDAKALKKGLLVAVPLTLVAAVPGLVGRSSWPGRIALAVVATLLALAAILFTTVAVAAN